MSNSTDNNNKPLVAQTQTLNSLVQKGNEIVSGVNNLFSFAHNIESLLAELHKQTNMDTKQRQSALFWSNQTTRPLPFNLRTEQKRVDLHNAQQQVSTLITDNPGMAVSDVASSASALSAVNPAALVVTSAVTLIDGYLTRRALRQGFKEVNKTLREGFDNVMGALDQGFNQVTETLQSGFKQLDARFAWGFNEIMWRIDQQSETSEKILNALVYVKDTRAHELRERGIRSYNYGWYPEALVDLTDALEKARVDYVAAHYIGNIYLFHMRDYEKAVRYYGLAARYSKPYHNTTPHYLAALMHQALAYYLSTSGDTRENCKQAAICIKEALKVAPDNLELHYQYAQYSAVSEDKEPAVESFEKIIRIDPKYIVKVLSEPDFAVLASQIEDLVLAFQRELSASYNKLFLNYMAKLRPVLEFYDSFSNTPEFKDKKDADRFLNGKNKTENLISTLTAINETYSAGDIFSIYAAFERLSQTSIPNIKVRSASILSHKTWHSYYSVYWEFFYGTPYSRKVSHLVGSECISIFKDLEYYAIGEDIL